ncbi:MAG: hypothetical protein A2W91_02155 [Bacteroidetes bacterium GWF2_38_335]|nr:MAG: hypothetical protein A2W91_02155 [Bacteroidetes bacterium GWF2_38_335]OFY80655.1 MAG: hypothetical protein A2281_05170 [Bacteroidetes bacterium RIFOXYA12_FULL_38_20]HBS86997.1 hypothetical protein [Bacteroidales bacterium]
MRKTFIFLTLLISLSALFSSCKKEKEENLTPAESKSNFALSFSNYYDGNTEKIRAYFYIAEIPEKFPTVIVDGITMKLEIEQGVVGFVDLEVKSKYAYSITINGITYSDEMVFPSGFYNVKINETEIADFSIDYESLYYDIPNTFEITWDYYPLQYVKCEFNIRKTNLSSSENEYEKFSGYDLPSFSYSLSDTVNYEITNINGCLTAHNGVDFLEPNPVPNVTTDFGDGYVFADCDYRIGISKPYDYSKTLIIPTDPEEKIKKIKDFLRKIK